MRFFGSRELAAAPDAWKDPVFSHTLPFYLFDLPFYSGLLGFVFVFAHLVEAHLSDADLCRSFCLTANLCRANLCGAYLVETNLNCPHLRHCFVPVSPDEYD